MLYSANSNHSYVDRTDLYVDIRIIFTAIRGLSMWRFGTFLQEWLEKHLAKEVGDDLKVQKSPVGHFRVSYDESSFGAVVYSASY